MIYELDGLGLIPGVPRFFSFSQCPDLLWGTLSLFSNGYQEVENVGAIPPFPHMSS
jgi:hypothetical protein